jgi:hypothetical protein
LPEHKLQLGLPPLHVVVQAPHVVAVARSAHVPPQQAGTVPVHVLYVPPALPHWHTPPLQVSPFPHGGVQVFELPVQVPPVHD